MCMKFITIVILLFAAWGSSRSGSVKQYSSEAERLQLTLEENQA